MLLSYLELKELVRGAVIQNVPDELINQTSIDITLDKRILIERPVKSTVVLGMKDKMPMDEYVMDDQGYVLQPGEFILAGSVQVFNLPNYISCEYKLKSSMARIGLNHLNAGWCDAGWHGSVLTLELVNCSRFHSLVIKPGDRIGQVVFFAHKPVPDYASYAQKGRYNGDKSVSGVKPEVVSAVV